MSVPSPWVATCNSLYAKPAAFEHSMLQDGLFGVLAARGCISTASWKKRGNSILIYQNWKYGYLSDNIFYHCYTLKG